MFDKKSMFFHHIHLKLNNGINLFYTMKSINDNTNEINYSNTVKLNIFSDPAKGVRNMINNYYIFQNSLNPTGQSIYYKQWL